MLPYLLLLFISIITPLVVYRPMPMISASGYSELAQKRNKITIVMFFMGLFILLALRDISVGMDLTEYKSIFERSGHTSFSKLRDLKWEIGYTIYNKFVYLISKEYRLFLILTALITLIPICILYSKEKRYSVLLIALFINMPCFLIIFSGLRQAIAISIGVVAYMAIENNKIVLSALLIMLAVCFHISAFILVLLYPMRFLKIKTKHLLYIAPAMAIIYIFKIQIFNVILNFVPKSYIRFYGDVQQTGAFGMLMLFLLFLVFSFIILDENLMSKRDYFMRNILLATTIFQFFVPIHGLIQRGSYYFLIFVPISILSVVQAPKRRLKNISDIAVIVMGCFFLLYFFYNASFSTDNLLNVFPYKFFWSN